MVRRISSVILALWALQASPALCIAGAFFHPCNDHPQHTDEDHGDFENHDHSADGSYGSCSHENDCPTDPCQGAEAIKLGSMRTIDHASLLLTPVITSTMTSSLKLPPDDRSARLNSFATDAAASLLTPSGSLPLLI